MNINKFIFRNLIYYPAVSLKTKRFFIRKKEMDFSQWKSKDDIACQSLKKIKNIIKYSKENTIFYSDKFKGIDVEDIKDLASVSMLPCVTKKDLKNRQNDILSKEKSKCLTKKTTGGSTGEPVTVYKTKEAMGAELAATWRGHSWAGVYIGDKQARFWGVPFGQKDKMIARLIDFVCNRKRFSAFSFDYSSMNDYFRELKQFRPNYFYGYVSMLYEFANFLEETNNNIDFKINAIITTAEVLHENQKTKLESVFGAKVFNEYGCGEIGTIAHECEHGSMHISAENMIVEILHGDRPCDPGEVGEIVVTELNNKAMPLIRYRLGDFACFSKIDCPCGRTLPVIENIYGRAYDTIKTKDGRMFHGEFFMYIFEEAKRKDLGIGKFQVVQKDFSRILVKVVPESNYGTATEKLIMSRIIEQVGDDVEVNFEIVKNIPRESSGKMSLIVGMGN